ncbi:hypothetical protein GCM10011571_32160 [Marinithermofilum abyssi]|uniref:Uncharacterized protein n=1 Tax=Marinithermofilum abyssi TaxID=1571185 RepID=A0A8J2VI36_9BACL|nr:hypothetical protein [Marinithermofilum abyssi]GGE27491.1 hypothetical protein GCM10011571_32160 [Marinithermofilum abyssi]
MRKMDIQIDIAREKEGMQKEEFHQDLRSLLEKYFEVNSIRIRKEVHTIEVENVKLKETEENHVMPDTLDIERQPLVQVFADVSEPSEQQSNPKKPAVKKKSEKKNYF